MCLTERKTTLQKRLMVKEANNATFTKQRIYIANVKGFGVQAAIKLRRRV